MQLWIFSSKDQAQLEQLMVNITDIFHHYDTHLFHSVVVKWKDIRMKFWLVYTSHLILLS